MNYNYFLSESVKGSITVECDSNKGQPV